MREAETISLKVAGMRCAGCVDSVESALRSVQGVRRASVNLATGLALVEANSPDLTTLRAAVEHAGFRATPLTSTSPAERLAQIEAQAAQEESLLHRHLALSALVALVLFTIPWLIPHQPALIISLLAAVLLQGIVGRPYYLGAWNRLIQGSADMDTLIALGTTAALLYSLAVAFIDPHSHGYAHDSVMVLALVTLGKWLEGRSRRRAGQAIRELLRLTPSTATRIVEEKLETVPIDALLVHDLILVRPGESFPVDGTIIDGQSTVDTSMLTGESMPIETVIGQTVAAGTINLSGLLRIKATQVGGDTTLANIIRLVDEAQSSKPQLARFADRVASRFVPFVLAISMMTFLGHLLATVQAGPAVRAAVCVLIVACPCAMGLATPTAIMVATGLGAKMGAFIRRAQAIEEAGHIDTLFLDKTGTITEGKPSVTSIEPAPGYQADDLLRWAAAAEKSSQHPWACAIVAEANSRGMTIPVPQSSTEIAGSGIIATIDHQNVIVGKRSLLESNGIPSTPTDESGVFVALHRQFVGRLLLADQPKPNSVRAIDLLTRQGIDVHLLTGDSEQVARDIAARVGILPHHVHSAMTPADKERRVTELRSQGQHVAMVGDGINDGPALAAASLGIAMGQGTDVAKEAGDIVLSTADLMGLVRTLALCRATVTKIKQNLWWAFAYNAILIPLAAMGYLSPTLSAAAMAASSVSVVTNSLLLRWGSWDLSMK
jgi:Cu+-exporting ATPase